MSLRRLVLVALLLGCGGDSKQPSKEPKTAKEKQLQEARASGEADPPSNKWAGWRYQGARNDCFYVLGRRCYKTEKAACAVAKCKAPKACVAEGGGPATIECK